MIVISPSLSLVDTVASGGGVVTADNPVIGYEQLVTAVNVSATTEASGYPATNLANVSTNLRWQGAELSPTADEYITLALDTADDVDYVGIARHNFGTQQIAVSLEIYDEDQSPPAWEEVITDFIPADDSPIIMRFTPQAISSCRIRMQAGNAAPTAAVVFAGKLLVLQRRIYVGHTPIPYGRSVEVANHRSVSGDFLGRVVLSGKRATSFTLSNITPEWYRTYLDPFIVAAQEDPFFFAWRPGTYPYEVGYAWLTEDPIPTNQLSNGMMQVSFSVEGVT